MLITSSSLPEIKIDNRLFGTKEGISILPETPLGNPFKIGDQDCVTLERISSKQAVQKAYERWLRWQIYLENEIVLTALSSLVQGGTLICTCNHETCHGYVIKDIIEEALNVSQNQR